MTKMISSIVEDASCHCKTELIEKKFSYTWSILDFQKIYNFGIVVDSDKATNNFRFRMSPHKEANYSRVNFYCWLEKPNYNSLNILYSVFLKTNDGNMTCVANWKNFFLRQHIDDNLLYKLYISEISSKNYLSSNNALTICFKMHIFERINNNSISYAITTRFAVTNADIFVPEEKSDSLITFVVNEERLQASKKLLCLKSKVFKTMFNCDLKESVNNEVEITDIKYDILKELLFFIQIGYLSKTLEENVNAMCELFVAADKYDIQDLKLICEQFLIFNTTVENGVEHLKIAHLYNGEMLKKYAKDFMKLYLEDFVHTPKFISLMQMYPELLLYITQIEEIEIEESVSSDT